MGVESTPGVKATPASQPSEGETPLYQDTFTNQGTGWDNAKLGDYFVGYHGPEWYHIEIDSPNSKVPISEPSKTNYEDVTEVAVVVRERGRVLVRHCQPGERWAGLWDFPRFAATNERDSGMSIERQVPLRIRELAGLEVVAGQRLTTLKHGVTRFRITLHCYEATRVKHSPGGAARGNVQWVTIDQLTNYPLSVTGRKIARLIGEAPRAGRSTLARLVVTLDKLRH